LRVYTQNFKCLFLYPETIVRFFKVSKGLKKIFLKSITNLILFIALKYKSKINVLNNIIIIVFSK